MVRLRGLGFGGITLGDTHPAFWLTTHPPTCKCTNHHRSAFLKFLTQEHGLRTVGCGIGVLGASSSAAAVTAVMPTPATATTKGTTCSTTGGRSSASLAPPSTISSSKRSHAAGGGVKRARLSMNEPLVVTEEALAAPPAAPLKDDGEEEQNAAAAAAGGAKKAGGRRTLTKSLSSGHFQLVATSGGSSKSRRKGTAAAASASVAAAVAMTPREEAYGVEAGQTPLTAPGAGGGSEMGAAEEGAAGMQLPMDGLMPKPAPIRLSINDPHRPTLKFVTPSPQAPSSGSQRRGRMMKL